MAGGSGVSDVVQTRIPAKSTWRRVLLSRYYFPKLCREYSIDLFVDLYYRFRCGE